jgi:uncharacterized protein YabE (DUF348 family)
VAVRPVALGLSVLAVWSGHAAWEATAKTVALTVDGRLQQVSTHGTTVGDVLQAAHVKVGPHDLLAPVATAALRNGTVVRITRVDGRTSVENDPIPFSVVRKPDASMYRGDTKVIRAGRVGVMKRTYALRFVNGKLAGKKLTKAVRTAEPVAKILRYGTKKRPYSVPGADHLNWWRLAQCESGNNPRSTGGNGTYRGLYQFTLSSWHGVGGKGDPIDWGRDEQTYRAKLLYMRRGSSPWPTCGHYLYS